MCIFGCHSSGIIDIRNCVDCREERLASNDHYRYTDFDDNESCK